MNNICFLKTPFDAVLKITDDGNFITRVEYVQHACGCCLGALASPLGAEACRQLKEYFSGKRREFDLPFEIKGSEFQQALYKALLEIPYGQTVSYGQAAQLAGHKGAARACGSALSLNPLPVIVPCHRVICQDGRIGGYTPDVRYKEALLQIEGIRL